jgi:hypothetical protein
VYTSCEFKGMSTPLSDGEYADLPFSIRNRIFSIRIPQGKEVLLYSGRGFTGSYMQLIGDRNCMLSNNEYMINSIKKQIEDIILNTKLGHWIYHFLKE